MAFSLGLSEETRERLARLWDLSRIAIHYGWVPFVLYLGWRGSASKPNLFRILSPFPV
ncbi:hypothetical protein CANCADRAFT_37012 [Tortispora caseinolytica NRRL Y-17796]|uniref:Tom7-domain-containing protein n=1 Tax=Tortispora caseinolytica NRRL Y-17796 TaxID=767744 RepID=A0A1E4TEV8_9ASCO|nr:hypothetical protein CANCADRAFT_37012 [Tortispora caseinolytica NRRL Y-17796]